MKNIDRTYSFTYKDANRVWWKVTVRMDRVDENSDPNGDPDHWWHYTVLNEDTQKIHFYGDIWAQFDFVPNVADIVSDMMTQTNRLALGMVEYAKFVAEPEA